MKYLIDTDIASYFLRGKFSLDKVFKEKDPSEITLSAVTVAEMQVVAYKNPQSKLNLQTISKFAQWAGVLDLDQETWMIFAKTKAETLQRGEPRGDLDILQVAVAMQYDLVVVTHNLVHYTGLVDCEDWSTN